MEPRIKILKEKKLVGMFVSMSLAENKTFKLFSTFMPRRKEILNSINNDVLDLIVYPKDYYLNFNPSNYFIKWALAEVSDIENVPNEMEAFILEGGKYAVFTQKGIYTDNNIFQYIFTKWLPNSDFIVDDRPHFDVLGEKYQQKVPGAEQEIWIPIKLKNKVSD